MCELFALSSKAPATATLSLETFAAHGGDSAPNKDGWGVAYFEDGDVRRLRDSGAAFTSPWVRFVEEQGLSSTVVVSHIRKATVGAVALRNTQPYCRELGGRMHVFAHNGHVPDVEGSRKFALGAFHPVGETDSEHAFCALLQRVADAGTDGVLPPRETLIEVVASFAADLRALGPANFIYSDGEVLIAHGHRRRQSDGNFGAPGLHTLCRQCAGIDAPVSGGGLTVASPRQQVTLVASVPLTDEAWTPLGEGELVVLEAGHIRAAA